MDRAEKSYTAQKRPFPKPGTTEYEQLKGQAVTFLIQRAEFAQEADAMGIKITDDQVDKRIEQLKKQFYGGSDVALQEGTHTAGTDGGPGEGGSSRPDHLRRALQEGHRHHQGLAGRGEGLLRLAQVAVRPA